MNRTGADEALTLLRRADKLLDAMTMEINSIIFRPNLRSKLLSYKDEIKSNIEGAAGKVVGIRRELKTAIDRVTQLEGMPGAWTDADVAEIKASMVKLDESFTVAFGGEGEANPGTDPASRTSRG